MPHSSVYLKDLEMAIQRVDNKYCTWRNRGDILQKTERVFAYELYHQFRTLTADRPEYYELRFDGELTKTAYSNELNNCGCLIQADFNSERFFSPDLVLHLKQADRSNQALIVEIKTKDANKADIANDIIKLNYYIEHLGFRQAVFISVNTVFDSIKGKIKSVFPNQGVNTALTQRNFHNITVFNYKSGILLSETLDNIVA